MRPGCRRSADQRIVRVVEWRAGDRWRHSPSWSSSCCTRRASRRLPPSGRSSGPGGCSFRSSGNWRSPGWWRCWCSRAADAGVRLTLRRSPCRHRERPVGRSRLAELLARDGPHPGRGHRRCSMRSGPTGGWRRREAERSRRPTDARSGPSCGSLVPGFGGVPVGDRSGPRWPHPR